MSQVQEQVSATVEAEEQRTVVRTQQVKKLYKMGDIEVHALRGVGRACQGGWRGACPEVRRMARAA